MEAIFVTCHENVLRLAAIDCSSPMSAKTDSEDRQLRAARGREMQAGFGHQGVKPRCFQRHRLASCVGPGHDQGGRRRDQEQIDRNGLGGG